MSREANVLPVTLTACAVVLGFRDFLKDHDAWHIRLCLSRE